MTSTAAGPRIGSLFSGVGGLDLAVLDVLGGEVVWHSQYEPPDKHGKVDKHQYAARVLAHRWPDVPNLGDITAVDWTAVLDEHGPVDVLIGGFPCTNLSLAGKQVGLVEGTASGLWRHMALAIDYLKPSLVIIENVRGLLSAPADSDLEPCPWCLGDRPDEPVLRALGCVLGDLADLGFDAEWLGLPASAVGACHERWREFVLAWPAHASSQGCEGAGLPGRAAEHAAVAADAHDLGHERRRGARNGGIGPADRSDAAADTDINASGIPDGYPSQRGRTGPTEQTRLGSGTVADADGRRREGNQKRYGHAQDGQPEHQPRLDAVGRGLRGEAPADSDDDRAGEEHQGTNLIEEQRQAERRRPVQFAGPDGDCPPGDRGDSGEPAAQGASAPVEPLRGGADASWGPYGPAIAQWEHLLGRPAPAPTDDLGRLNPVFVEWMMGLPAGHVTDVPGLPRSAQLKALGNGVVPAQAAAALPLLFARLAGESTR